MKKFKNIAHLEAEKQRLKDKREALEVKMRLDWYSLRDSIKPLNMAKEAIQDALRKKAEKEVEEETVLKSALNYALGLLLRKFG
ncbi:MAG: hypothetical protein SFU20_00560 [Chitinophagaceae bacterium]|nr:hypothetical protein [Chitinophagaceae bacterium]